MEIVELFQRGITEQYITNLMRAARLNRTAAEMRIRLLFPIVRRA
jgi:hypothetical protein